MKGFLNIQILWGVVLSHFRRKQFWGHAFILSQWTDLVSPCVLPSRDPVPQACSGRALCKGSRTQRAGHEGATPFHPLLKCVSVLIVSTQSFRPHAAHSSGTGTPQTLSSLAGKEDEFLLSCCSCWALAGIIKPWQGWAGQTDSPGLGI